MFDRLRLCLPGKCLLCDFPVRRVINLCKECESILPANRYSCGQCGITLSAESWSGSCARCLLTPPPFASCHGVFRYHPPITRLVADFKFRGDFASGRVLGWLLARTFVNHYAAVTAVSASSRLPLMLVPVPLHDGRLRERGFNQAVFLGRMVARATGLPLHETLLTRVRHTEAQSRLSSRQRATNIARAFRVTRPPPADRLGHVALIDDVVTTTATVTAATRALIAAGASRVDVWAAARA